MSWAEVIACDPRPAPSRGRIYVLNPGGLSNTRGRADRGQQVVMPPALPVSGAQALAVSRMSQSEKGTQ